MYKRILVAVDGSDTSDLALKTAIRLAKDQKASLRILHVADLSPATLAVADMPGADPDLLDKIVEAIQAGGQTILTRSLNEARAVSIEADTSLETFRIPVGQISDVIEEQAEFVERRSNCCRNPRPSRVSPSNLRKCRRKSGADFDEAGIAGSRSTGTQLDKAARRRARNFVEYRGS